MLASALILLFSLPVLPSPSKVLCFGVLLLFLLSLVPLLHMKVDLFPRGQLGARAVTRAPAPARKKETRLKPGLFLFPRSPSVVLRPYLRRDKDRCRLSLGALTSVASPAFGRPFLLSLPLQTYFSGSSSLLTVGKK